jgi:GAF domain-containing protein
MTVTLQTGSSAEEKLSLMIQSVKALLEEETELIPALANVSAAIKMYLDETNWAGFYILKGKELILGPFQGLPACARIGEGRGVCGRAVSDQRPLVVPDVRAFPGHIACDSASNSEIVVPLFRKEKIFGVLDVDSPVLNRFGRPEEEALVRAGGLISAFLDTVPGGF